MKKIGIIEDDKVIREELRTLLLKYGYEVALIDDFGQAVELVMQQNPHLILLDINLPVYDGYYLCKEIRKRSKVPIIVVTSRDSDIDELMSINLGADDFVTKPYNTQILLARIAALLNRTYEMEVSKELQYRDMALDVGKGIVHYNGEQAELTKNEMRILKLLLEKKGQIVSRDEMMNQLWQSDEFVDDNTLTVNINRLRKKLMQIGAHDYLKTRRGQGYSL